MIKKYIKDITETNSEFSLRGIENGQIWKK